MIWKQIRLLHCKKVRLAWVEELMTHCRQVDHILRTFKDMNKEMRRTGSFKPVAKKEELLQMVAQNNLLFSDIVSKLGIMERFDIAWKHTNCNDVYEHLRTDMEIENRNDNLQVKVRLNFKASYPRNVCRDSLNWYTQLVLMTKRYLMRAANRTMT